MQMPQFDANHAIFFDEPSPSPLAITEFIELKDVKGLEPSTQVLLAQVGDKSLAIPTLSMVYHKVAQGVLDNTPFVMTFCVLCNFGGVFSPTVDNVVMNFGCYGYHQGMIMLGDAETQSCWNHITGDCVAGEKIGSKLQSIGQLQHTTIEKVLSIYPDALITYPHFTEEESEIAHRWNNNYRSNQPDWSNELTATFVSLDNRLPRFDMGLGIWTENTARYYSVLTINAHNNVILDTVDGHNVVIYYDNEAGLPTAFYTDATSITAERDGVSLNNEQFYHNSVLLHNAEKIIPERPKFQVIRWYGFSYLFPECEIYGRG